MAPTSDKWKKYLDKYQYLLAHEWSEHFPYKELAKKLGLKVANVQHMADYMKKSPEVIAWIRAQFSPETIPSWVGDIDTPEGYEEYLRNIGLTLPSSVSDMSVSDMSVSGISDSVSEKGSVPQQNIPATPSAIEANTKKTERDRDTQSETEAHRQRQTETDRKEETETHRNLPRNDTEKPSKPRVLLKAPTSIIQTMPDLPTTPVVITPELKGKPDVSVKEESTPSVKAELVKEMQNIQFNDPDVVPMAGGGYGRMQRDASGVVRAIIPIATIEPKSSSKLEELVSQTTAEDLTMNTIGLMRRVALNPAVTMGHTYVTSTRDPKSGKIFFIGDLAEWINYCVEYTLRDVFGVRFGIFTGMPSKKDVIYNTEENN